MQGEHMRSTGAERQQQQQLPRAAGHPGQPRQLIELAQAELAGDGDGAYQGSWTFMGSSGQEMGPFLKSELISMFEK